MTERTPDTEPRREPSPGVPHGDGGLTVQVAAGPELVRRAAEWIAESLESAIHARGRATVAFSGGSSAPPLLAALVGMPVRWHDVVVFQVDERVAPRGDPARNLTALQRILVDEGPLPAEALRAMPVEVTPLEAAAARYGGAIRDVLGDACVFDLVHLGLGSDGHTASLVPDAPELLSATAPVALTPPYQGHRRMTLTLPLLSGARRRMWFVPGATKAEVVGRLVRGDRSIPAGRVERSRAVLFVDDAAARDIVA